MKFLTLAINPPEEVKPILGMYETVWGKVYEVIDLDEANPDLDMLVCVMQNKGITHWNYIEDEGNE